MKKKKLENKHFPNNDEVYINNFMVSTCYLDSVMQEQLDSSQPPLPFTIKAFAKKKLLLEIVDTLFRNEV